MANTHCIVLIIFSLEHTAPPPLPFHLTAFAGSRRKSIGIFGRNFSGLVSDEQGLHKGKNGYGLESSLILDSKTSFLVLQRARMILGRSSSPGRSLRREIWISMIGNWIKIERKLEIDSEETWRNSCFLTWPPDATDKHLR